MKLQNVCGDNNCLINLPKVVELELNEDWFWHADFEVSSSSSEDDFMGCDVGDEANGKFVGSRVDLEDSILGISIVAVTPGVGWWPSTLVEWSKIGVKF